MRYKTLVLPLIAVLLSGCGFSLAGDVTPPPGYTPPPSVPVEATSAVYPLIPADPQKGKLIYTEQCAGCHGITGRGDGSQSTNLGKPPEILSDPAIIADASPSQLYQVITEGIPGNNMPAFSAVLDDRSRWDVTAYLFMLSTDADELAAGKDLFDKVCADCHGLEGKGDGAQARGLPLQPPDFTKQSILTPRTNLELLQIVTGGSSNVMPAFEEILTEEQRQQVVTYVRTLSFADVLIPTAVPTRPEAILPTESQEGTPSPDGEPAETAPATPTAVNISGRVINDSGGNLPPMLQVSLLVFDQMTKTNELTTQVRFDGSYVFDQVEMTEGRIFVTSVTYDGQVFNSQPSFHPGLATEEEDFVQSENIVLDIHISDATTDISALTTDRMHLFIDFPQPGIIQIVELLLISNNGSEVVIPPADGTGGLIFTLPEGATNLQFDDSTLGERYMPVENGFFDTVAIQPGQSTHQVLFAFDLPYDNKATISIPVPLKTNSISVMVPVDGVKLKSEQLLDGGIRSSQQMTFQMFNGSDFASGSTLDLSLSGSPKMEATTENKLNVNPILFGAGTLILVITGIVYYYFRQKENGKRDTDDAEVGSDKEAIMDAIIVLDEQFKTGNLNEQAYHQRRAELKEQLRKLL